MKIMRGRIEADVLLGGLLLVLSCLGLVFLGSLVAEPKVLLGRALTEAGQDDGARRAYEKGIDVAAGKGDVQAAKEMTVFLRRLDKRSSPENKKNER